MINNSMVYYGGYGGCYFSVIKLEFQCFSTSCTTSPDDNHYMLKTRHLCREVKGGVVTMLNLYVRVPNSVNVLQMNFFLFVELTILRYICKNF